MRFHFRAVVGILMAIGIFMGSGLAIGLPFYNPWWFLYSLAWVVFQFGFLMPNHERITEYLNEE